MASIISASTTSGTALNMSADTTGVLQFATGATPTTALTIDTSQRAAFVAGTAALPAITTTGDTNTGMWFPAADTIAFSEGGTESMRINSSGNLLVNTTSNYFGRISVAFSPLTHTGITFKQSIDTNIPTPLYFLNAAETAVGSVVTSATTTIYNTSSDYRLKDNITPMTGALNTITQLKPVTYTWKTDGSDGQGFIAHELQEVVPDCVTGEKDAVETYTDEEGNEQTRIKPQGIDTSFLVATLTAAIQELKAIVDAQAIRIETLEAK